MSIQCMLLILLWSFFPKHCCDWLHLNVSQSLSESVYQKRGALSACLSFFWRLSVPLPPPSIPPSPHFSLSSGRAHDV